MSWTEDRIDLLKKLWDQGQSASQIAEELGGGITRNAVIGKAHRLGLKARPSPVKSDSNPNKTPAPTKAAKTAPPPKTPAAKPPPAKTPPPAAAKKAQKPPETAAPARAVAHPTTPRPPAPPAPPPVMAAPPPPAAVAPPPPRSTLSGPQPPSMPPAPPRRLVGKVTHTQPVKGKVTLLDLSEKVCRWPFGHPGEEDFHFCGKGVNPGTPYCPEHCTVAYQSQLPRKDRPHQPRPVMPNISRFRV